jgi:dipeptidyl aminopeptidase/acylaminoacyl peptidase
MTPGLNSSASPRSKRSALPLVLIIVVSLCLQATAVRAGSRNFTVADDISLTEIREPILFSPDRQLFLVVSERGRLDLSQPESSIRFYQTQDIQRFILGPRRRHQIQPLWTITRSTYKDGPIISDVRWLASSNEVVFLERTHRGNNQLFFANVRTKSVIALTPLHQNVTGFDVRSQTRFVYTVFSPAMRQSAEIMQKSVEIDATGRDLSSLIFPDQNRDPSESIYDLGELWASVNGVRVRVVEPESHRFMPIHTEGQRALSLSPNGRFVATALTVTDVPKTWEDRYRSANPSFPHQVRTMHQDPYHLDGRHDISEYVVVDLLSGKVRPLASAPLGNTAGWVGATHADWAADGKSVVLSDTFLSPRVQIVPTTIPRPCDAVVDIPSGKASCVDYMKKEGEDGDAEEWRVYDAHFVRGDENVVAVKYAVHGTVNYHRSSLGVWLRDNAANTNENSFLHISVQQDLNIPPVLIASDTRTHNSRVVWNPNPQLQEFTLGRVSAFQWKDTYQRNWTGGLYRPVNLNPGERYPLIIQTHGFDDHAFQPSGSFPTAFAAQELASAGFVVLQVEDCPVRDSLEEGPCQAAGYEGAISQLSKLGLIDSNRVGIIGFSRTCYYVLHALTLGHMKFKAASITDGVDAGYLQYLTSVDRGDDGLAREYNAMIGAAPFGEGLENWFLRSPEFNMDEIQTPLQVVALGRQSTLLMWEPYAVLRYLAKPVDLLVINTNEHILSNPEARLISQGTTVDWFRFWLQNYEDPSPAKYAQYKRWEVLKVQQQAREREQISSHSSVPARLEQQPSDASSK